MNNFNLILNVVIVIFLAVNLFYLVKVDDKMRKIKVVTDEVKPYIKKAKKFKDLIDGSSEIEFKKTDEDYLSEQVPDQ